MSRTEEPAEIVAYRTARQQVLDAAAQMRRDGDETNPEDAERLRVAHEALTAAEAAVGPSVIQAAWEANRRAVGDAKNEASAAMSHAVDIERRCIESATRRNPERPIFNAEEQRIIAEAQRVVHQAVLTEDEAKAAFKAGVTADQLAAATRPL